MEPRYTSNDVVGLTGMTARQLQWWDEQGIVVPQREGRRRLYSVEDLAEVAVIGELRARGFSLQRIRKVMRFLQREMGKRLVETVTGSEYHLLTAGDRIYLGNSASQILDILKNARQPIFAICLSDAVRQVRAQLAPERWQRRATAIIEQKELAQRTRRLVRRGPESQRPERLSPLRAKSGRAGAPGSKIA